MRILLFIIMIFTPVFSAAQKTGGKADTMYVKKYSDKFIAKLSLTNAGESFAVKGTGANYNLKPNTELKTKLGFNYRFIAFSIGFAPDILPGNNDNARKGSSEIKSINLNLIFTHWMQYLAYSRTRGYYIRNSGDFIDDWDEGDMNYIQFPELYAENFTGYTAYKFNKNYSVKAVNNQTEHQVKSCGSLIAYLRYRYYTIDNKELLTEFNSSQRSENFEGTAQLGYFYNYIWHRNFYLSGGIAAGAGFINSSLLTRTFEDQIKTQTTNPLVRMEVECALGYNSKRFFSGLQFIGWAQKHAQGNSNTSIENDALNIQVFAGYRFGAPQVINKLFDKYGL